MDRVSIKYAPALNDLTVDDCFSDEGMEAVLFEEEQARLLSRNRKAAGGANYDSSDEQSVIYEKPEDAELLNVIHRRDWDELLYRIETQPHIAYVKFSGRSTSAGNLLLHEACRHQAPIDTIEVLVDANEDAVRAKGHSGYLPLHYACSSGASERVVELLLSIYPDAVQVADDHSHTLPIHLASKMGAAEEAFMILLTAYPEAAKIRDDFGRLPMDYAKNILNETMRDTIIGCLQQARWLLSATKHARETTEREYQRRIRGYEESQAAHLKMIKEVHDEEIMELEKSIEEQREELSLRREQMEEMEKRKEGETEEYKRRIATLEKLLVTKDEEVSSRLDQEHQHVAQVQVAFDLKIAELKEVSRKLEHAQQENVYLKKQVESRTRDFHIALEDVETLNKHAEWLESILGSIRHIANSEAPITSVQRGDPSNHTIDSTMSDSSRRCRRVSPTRTTSRSKSKFETSIPRYGRKMSASVDPSVFSARNQVAGTELDRTESRSDEDAFDFHQSQGAKRRDGDDE
jgi:hypothetical protein